MPDGILDQRLDRHRRHDGAPRLLRHADRHIQVRKARALQPQIALDVLDLLSERHVRAAIPEQVAGELGEVDQQIARLLGPGVNLPGHGGQRVVDEMRGDLGPQGSQLGL